MKQSLLRISSYAVNAALLLNVLSGADITQHAKKSIFPTTNADRENQFINYFFAPLIESDELVQVASGSYTCGVPSKFRLETSGFELHSPYAPMHDSGGLEVDYVESKYKEKWDNLLSDNNNGWYYDAILDNNMAFWVTDLATFDGYSEDYVDRIYLKWQWNGETYYSMIVHNRQDGADMNQFELISDTFTGSEKTNFITSEPRAYIDDLNADYASYCETNNVQMIEIGIRKAVSNAQENMDWYISTFRGAITDVSSQVHSGEFVDANGNEVKYAHILIQSDDSFMISFFERNGDKATFGDFTIESFETQLLAAHANVMVNPFCCVDRWYDLHYAIPLNDDVASVLILDSIMQNPKQMYEVFEIAKNGGDNDGKGMFWTMVEPNGQIVQLQGPDYTSEEVSVEFFVDPSYWDGQWCPQENEDEFEDYTFGDQIATITITNKGEISDNDSDNKEEKLISANYGSSSSGSEWHVDIYEAALIIFVSLLVVGVLGCSYVLLCGYNKTEEKISYQYSTFE